MEEKEKKYGEAFTVQELAQRWQVSSDTIRRYEADGTLRKMRGISAVRFPYAQIMEFEWCGDIGKYTPEYAKMLEKENSRLQELLDEKIKKIRQIREIAL